MDKTTASSEVKKTTPTVVTETEVHDEKVTAAHDDIVEEAILDDKLQDSKNDNGVTTAATTGKKKHEPIVTPTGSGWKITLENSDGTVQEVLLKDKPHTSTSSAAAEAGEKSEDPTTEVKPMTRQMRIWIIVQHMLTGTTSAVIIVIMVLTLIQFNNTSSVAGAWPANALLTPTYLMLGLSVITLFADAISLMFQCCGARTSANAKKYMGYVRTACNVGQTILSASGTGYFKWAEQTSGGRDLFGWTCQDAADAKVEFNASTTLCPANTTAFGLGICQIVLHVLNVAIIVFAWWKPNGKVMEGSTADAKGLMKENNDLMTSLGGGNS